MDYSDTTVIIPVKDEPAAGKTAKAVLEKLEGSKVIVIFKGDRSKMGIDFKDKRMLVIEQKSSGKGFAVVQAAKKAKTDIMCLIDGDATYDVEDLKKVVALVRSGADMALGNRFHRLSVEAMPRYVQFGNRVITMTANLLYGMRLSDSQTGLRAIRKKVFDSLKLREQFFGIETEMNVKTRKSGHHIVETPIRYYTRVGSSKQFKLIEGLKLLAIDFKFLGDD